jgi:hypothetical protein
MNEDIQALVATGSRILAAAGQGDLIWAMHRHAIPAAAASG